MIRQTDGQAEQLRMLILGQGGTRKSMLIRAITETFQHYDKLDILAKCATTGIAATDIGAYTLHSWAGLMHNLPKDDNWLDRSSKASVEKRQTNIQGKEFLIVDEVSMEDKTTAYCLSEIIGKSWALEEKGRPHEPFGSMHIIQSGDFHQFPPVGNLTGALYVDRPERTINGHYLQGDIPTITVSLAGPGFHLFICGNAFFIHFWDEWKTYELGRFFHPAKFIR